MHKSFAVFDIDGTLIRWQLYHAVVDRMAKHNLLGNDAHTLLHDARMVWKRREDQEAFREYEITLINTYEKALLTINPDQFDTIVAQVAEEYGSQTYVYTRNLITELKDQNYILFAISGSQTELVEHIAKRYEFDDWVGTEYYRKSGKFTGEKRIASYHKEIILKYLIEKHRVSLQDSLAIGDSGSDIAMLKLVESPIAFNPDQTLYRTAKERGWKIVVERKNVVYELAPGYTGNYELR